jgi:hypothetical protein
MTSLAMMETFDLKHCALRFLRVISGVALARKNAPASSSTNYPFFTVPPFNY